MARCSVPILYVCRIVEESVRTPLTSDDAIQTQVDELMYFLNCRDVARSTSFDVHQIWFDKVFKIFKQRDPNAGIQPTHLYCTALKYLSLLIKTTDGFVAFTKDNNHLTASQLDAVNESLFYRRTFVDFCGPLFDELFLNLNSPNSSFCHYVYTVIFCLENFLGTDYAPVVRNKLFTKYSMANLLERIQGISKKHLIFLRVFMNMHLLFDCFTSRNSFKIEDISKKIDVCIKKKTYVYNSCLIHTCAKAIKYASIMNLVADISLQKKLFTIQIMPLRNFTELLTFPNNYVEPNTFEDSPNKELYSMFTFYTSFNSDMCKLILFSLIDIVRIICIIKQETLDYLIAVMSMVTDKLLHSDQWLIEDQNAALYQTILCSVFKCWSALLKNKSYFENCTSNELLVPLIHNNDLFFKNCSSELLQSGLQLITSVLNIKINENIFRKIDLKAYRTLCCTLNTNLLNSELEMRKCCLECILSLIDAIDHQCGKTYINIILDEDLPTKLLKMLKIENDPLSKLMILKCLEKMISVPDIWRRSLSESDLIGLCLMYVQCEMNGSVRVQLVSLITAVLMTPQIIGGLLFYHMCRVMVHVSIKDPLYEVKIFSYKFWEFIIDTLVLQPHATEQLNANIAQLDITGCFHVLYVTLKDENNSVVRNEAIRITAKMLPLIEHYSEISDTITSSGSNSTKRRRIGGLASDNSVTITTTINQSNDIFDLNPNKIFLIWKPDYEYILINDFLSYTSIYNFTSTDASKIE